MNNPGERSHFIATAPSGYLIAKFIA